MTVPKYILPALVVLALFGGYLLRNPLTRPSTETHFTAAGMATVECFVDGLKCKGTAEFFTRMYQRTPGIASIHTYAAEHRAVIAYDPAAIDTAGLRSAMEAPVLLDDGTLQPVFRCLAMK
ncbi:MAG: hypothetical protein C4524_04815 [Candidatus Zixiibacteriota bacterium]|nr:MAG: hypothetical protein C4524_04815 [candidate division Zixibacteria bacterium]